MKKLSFYLFATLAVAFFAACGSDNGCTMEGDWKVKSADLASDKFDSSILNMAKTLTLARTYSFTEDSVVVHSNGAEGDFRGIYEVDDVNNSLKLDALGSTGMKYAETMKIVNCGDGEVTLLQRTPADTTQQALSTSTIVLERTKK